MSNTLLEIAQYLWIVDFAALSVFFVLTIKNKKIYSSLVTLVVTVIISGIIIQYRTLVFSIKGPDTGQWYLMAWYTGFALFDGIVAYALYRVYKSYKAKYSANIQLLAIACMGAFLAGLIIVQFEPLLFDTQTSPHKLWIRVAYYLGTASLYCLAIHGIHKSHQICKIPYSVISRMYILAFFAATNLQVFRFLERYTWETDLLLVLYRWGLISINICTSAVTLIIASLAIYQHYSNKVRKGPLWNI